MKNVQLHRVGTNYTPVLNPESSSMWYQQNLGAVENYLDEEKAILSFANQSFFLVKAKKGERLQFIDSNGHTQFTITFEVDGTLNCSIYTKLLQRKG